MELLRAFRHEKACPPPEQQEVPDEERPPRGGVIPRALARRVRAVALEVLPPRQRATSNLYMDQWHVPAGTPLGPSFENVVVERDSVLVFADHQPLANFSHPCAYLLHDPKDGALLTHVPARFPPYPNEGIHLMEPFYQAVKPTKLAIPRVPAPTRPDDSCAPKAAMPHMARMLSANAAAPAGSRCAILLSGATDPHHVNDLELSWRTLTGTFGFDPDDIYVLVHNGTKTGAPFKTRGSPPQLRKWPGAAVPDNDFLLQPRRKGSIAGFRWALGEVSKKFRNSGGGLLYVQVEGHGSIRYGTGGGQFIQTYPDGAGSGDCYLNSAMNTDLATLLGGCDSLLVLMNQCYAGGFKDSVLLGSTAGRTFFASACEDNQVSVQTPDFLWNRFSRNWMQAETQPDPDGVDASEAYAYCNEPARRGLDTPLMGHAPLNTTNSSPADDIAMG